MSDLKRKWSSKNAARSQSNGRLAKDGKSSNARNAKTARLSKLPSHHQGQKEEHLSDDEGYKGAPDIASSKTARAKVLAVKSSSLTSREAHAAQRKLIKERKMVKQHADLMVTVKSIWEDLRRSNTAKDTRAKLLDKLWKHIEGKVAEVIFKHDASRIIQTALKYGNDHMRNNIAKELKGRFLELSKSSYGKFLVVKLLHYGSKDTRGLIINELSGKIQKLIQHREASYVIEDIYREYGDDEQRAAIFHELLGVEFAIFKIVGDKRSLSEIIRDNPEKKSALIQNLLVTTKGALTKGLLSWTLVHKALKEALQNAQGSAIDELIDLMKDQIAEICHTKDGADAAALLFAHGTAKDRKSMIKSLKPYIVKLAQDEYGYLVLLAIFETVDDTVLVGKHLLDPLLAEVGTLFTHKYARKAFLHLYQSDRASVIGNDALKTITVLRSIRSKTSKKDPEARREDLLNHFSSRLLSEITEHGEEHLKNGVSCQMLTETLLFAKGDKKDAIDAIVKVCSANSVASPMHIVHQSHVPRALRMLLLGGQWNSDSKKVDRVLTDDYFCQEMTACLVDQAISWATGDGSFVVVSYLEATQDSTALINTLLLGIDEIEEAASKNKGSALLLSIIKQQGNETK